MLTNQHDFILARLRCPAWPVSHNVKIKQVITTTTI